MSATDAAYVAGLIDGEGTIALTRKHAGENRQLAVAIASTERSILDYVRAVVGVGKITRKRVSKQNHAPGLCYAVTNRQALSLLRQTHLFLNSYKRGRAELVLENYLPLTPRNGKYTHDLFMAREAFVRRFSEIRPPGRGDLASRQEAEGVAP